MNGLAFAFLAFGILWTVGFLRAHRRAAARAAAAQGWPTAPGHIVESRIVAEESEDSQGNVTTSYAPVLRYTYEAGGRTHEGSRLRFGAVRSGSRAQVEGWLAPYLVDARPPVRYDPADPGESVLEAAKPSSTYFWMSLFGLIFVLFGILAAGE